MYTYRQVGGRKGVLYLPWMRMSEATSGLCMRPVHRDGLTDTQRHTHQCKSSLRYSTHGRQAYNFPFCTITCFRAHESMLCHRSSAGRRGAQQVKEARELFLMQRRRCARPRPHTEGVRMQTTSLGSRRGQSSERCLSSITMVLVVVFIQGRSPCCHIIW